MKKLIIRLLTTLALLVFPSIASADHVLPHPLAHSYNPMVVNMNNMNMMQARVENWISSSQMDRLVCVEAINTISGSKNHLGCATLNLDPRGTGVWWREFQTPVNTLPMGTYRITYNYMDRGMWHQITDTSDKLVNTTIQVK